MSNTGNLISIVYVSSATRQLSSAELVGILQDSNRNNAPLGITGMLLYKDGNFMQILEGPEEKVGQVLEKVKGDPRHNGFIQLNKKKIKDRRFGSWAMAFKNLSDLPPEAESSFSQFLNGSLLDERFQSKPDLCYKLMLSFKQNIR